MRTSQDAETPIVAVSMNYRLGVWGFLQTPQVLAEGSSNARLLDQRLALQCIKENVAAFGGDPDRVTVWGESVGAQSISLHLHSYRGRDDRLFHGAIIESGTPVGLGLYQLSFYASPAENLTRTVGCWTAENQLACLRGLSSEELCVAETSATWNPLVDGQVYSFFFSAENLLKRQRLPNSLSLHSRRVRLQHQDSLLAGTNSDEGLSFGVHSSTTRPPFSTRCSRTRRTYPFCHPWPTRFLPHQRASCSSFTPMTLHSSLHTISRMVPSFQSMGCSGAAPPPYTATL